MPDSFGQLRLLTAFGVLSIHNAAGDLLLMAAWSAACKSLKARRLPVRVCSLCSGKLRMTTFAPQISFFARDDRVYRAFVDQLNAHMGQLEPAIPLKLRRQLDLLREGMQGRRLSNKVRNYSSPRDKPPYHHEHHMPASKN